MEIGDRIVLKFRPVSGAGKIEGVSEDKWRVRLDDGMVLFADEDDLLPDMSENN